MKRQAAALSWAFYWIHASAAVLERLQSELDTLGENPEPGVIARLPYLTAVCQETLRVNPIALICTPRMTKEPLQLRVLFKASVKTKAVR
jgi:cytochrome P450